MQNNHHTQRTLQPNTHLPAPSIRARFQALAWRTAARIVLPIVVMGLRNSKPAPRQWGAAAEHHTNDFRKSRL